MRGRVLNGGCSSAVESRIVIPVVVGSNPISHPNIQKLAAVSNSLSRRWGRFVEDEAAQSAVCVGTLFDRFSPFGGAAIIDSHRRRLCGVARNVPRLTAIRLQLSFSHPNLRRITGN